MLPWLIPYDPRPISCAAATCTLGLGTSWAELHVIHSYISMIQIGTVTMTLVKTEIGYMHPTNGVIVDAIQGAQESI